MLAAEPVSTHPKDLQPKQTPHLSAFASHPQLPRACRTPLFTHMAPPHAPPHTLTAPPHAPSHTLTALPHAPSHTLTAPPHAPPHTHRAATNKAGAGAPFVELPGVSTTHELWQPPSSSPLRLMLCSPQRSAPAGAQPPSLASRLCNATPSSCPDLYLLSLQAEQEAACRGLQPPARGWSQGVPMSSRARLPPSRALSQNTLLSRRARLPPSRAHSQGALTSRRARLPPSRAHSYGALATAPLRDTAQLPAGARSLAGSVPTGPRLWQGRCSTRGAAAAEVSGPLTGSSPLGWHAPAWAPSFVQPRDARLPRALLGLRPLRTPAADGAASAGIMGAKWARASLSTTSGSSSSLPYVTDQTSPHFSQHSPRLARMQSRVHSPDLASPPFLQGGQQATRTELLEALQEAIVRLHTCM